MVEVGRMQTGKGQTPRTMWIGLVATTLAALLALLLCVTGLPDPLALPVPTLLLAAMVAGVITDVVVRRTWRQTTQRQRAWLTSLGEDLPDYRARVEDRERALYGWESRWWRPLGSAFFVALGAALVPFNLILPLADDVAVDPWVTAWVSGTLVVTFALVVRAVGAARIDSRGLALPAPAVAPSAVSQPSGPAPSAAEIAREESIAKYLVPEEDVAPEIRLAHELQRLTALLDEPGAPRPSLPVPADWLPAEVAPEPESQPQPEPAEVIEAEAVTEPVMEPAGGAPASTPEPAVGAETPAPAAEDPESPAGEQGGQTEQGELDKLAKWFHAA